MRKILRQKLKTLEQLEPRCLLSADFTIHNIAEYGGSGIDELFEFQNKIYYWDYSPELGSELHQFDPQTNTSRAITDLNPGSGSSAPGELSFFYAFDGKLLFTGYDPLHGAELRAYDPVLDSTMLLADIYPGAASSGAGMKSGMFEHYGKLYFNALTEDHGEELWQYDPVAGETSLVYDLFEGPASSEAGIDSGVAAIGGQIYFGAYDQDARQDVLWRWNPATRQPTLVLDSEQSFYFTSPAADGGFVSLAEHLYFSARDSVNGYEMRMLNADGVVSTVSEFERTFPDIAEYGGFAVMEDYLFFTTSGGETLNRLDSLTNVIETFESPGEYTEDFSQASGKLYFSARSNVNDGRDLYVFDPITQQVSPAAVLAENGNRNTGIVGDLLSFEDRIYFKATDSTYGTELRYYDPATEFVSVIDNVIGQESSLNGTLSDVVASEASIHFIVSSRDGEYSISSFDYSTQSVITGPVVFGGGGSSSPSLSGASMDGQFYFSASDGIHGLELWNYNSQSNVASLYADLRGGSDSGLIEVAGVLPDADGAALYLSGYDAELGFELIKLDDGMMQVVGDIAPGAESSMPYSFSVHGDELYFLSEYQYGSELWGFDPVISEAFLLDDINENGNSMTRRSCELHEMNSRLYFFAYSPAHGNEIREYDPETGVLTTFDVVPGPESSGTSFACPGFAHVGQNLYFLAENNNRFFIHELNTIDGTTRLVHDVNSRLFVADDEVYALAAIDGTVVFTYDDPNFGGPQFWSYEPSSMKLTSYSAPVIPGYYGGFVESAGNLYFSALNREFGYELWKFNSETGPVLAADISPGVLSSIPGEYGGFEIYNDKVYFSAADPIFGNELRQFDPATGLVRVVADVNEGPADSLAGVNSGFYFDNGMVYFAAKHKFLGTEFVSATIIDATPDFDSDGDFDCADIDALTTEIASGANTALFDLTGDNLVNSDDLAEWLQLAGSVNLDSRASYLVGDANLDGSVDVSDFNRWNEHKFSNSSNWCSGDFNADGTVDVSDFNRWNETKFTLSGNSVFPGPLDVPWTQTEFHLQSDIREFKLPVTRALATPDGYYVLETVGYERSDMEQKDWSSNVIDRVFQQ